MNPLTQVKNTQKITAREAALGVSDAGSWHAKYKDSAYIYAGNFSFDLTEGDLLAVFSQYGEIVDLNLVRDKATGKSRGFAFLAYEDQRSTILSVDNLNGASVIGRTIKVDHVANYKRKAEEDEEEEQRKREERGVCRAFQRGDCNRGSACKFSHDEKRSADTGWGSKDDGPRWGHDKYDRASQQPYRKRDEDGSKGDDRNRLKERERTERERIERDGHLGSKKEDRMYSSSARNGDDKHRSERDKREKLNQYKEGDDDGKPQRHKLSDDTQLHGRARDDVEEAQKSGKSIKTYAAHSSDDEFQRGHGRRTHATIEKRDDRRDWQDDRHSKLSR